MNDIPMGIVYSNTQINSTSNTVSINNHTRCIHFMNLSNGQNATVELNGGPHRVVIPHGHGWVEIEGDYTKFKVITENVDLAVYAIG